jgi:hypothetical protein
MIEPKNLNPIFETQGPPAPQPEGRGVESLNSNCFCITLDAEELKRELQRDPELRSLYPLILEKYSHMFAAMPVFVARRHVDRMAAIVRAAETVIALPAYSESVLEWAPHVARFDVNGARGVFLSYDFHVADAGPKLIEINTNAGGALLNAALARAQRACCPAIADMTTGSLALEALDQTFVTMFFTEWRLARGDRDLRRIAIVDENPREQYLYPEFILFKQLFRRHGVAAVIVDPAELRLHDNLLWHENEPVDLVYNRLTDFMLEDPAHAMLREAYLSNAVVLTPYPRVHALYANKRNLTVLSDPERLQSFGVSEDTARTLLSGIPRTEIVNASNAQRLWSERRKLFFKPAAGFGSRAAYRGDKLTKRVWEQIIAGDYVAQALVRPGDRLISRHQAPHALKFDVRNYVYDGAIQFITARLYQGQTTNLRTAGGGFAPVFTDIAAGSEPVLARCDASAMST